MRAIRRILHATDFSIDPAFIGHLARVEVPAHSSVRWL
jgi:hypothetical protein